MALVYKIRRGPIAAEKAAEHSLCVDRHCPELVVYVVDTLGPRWGLEGG
jgi:hypothetical protein